MKEVMNLKNSAPPILANDAMLASLKQRLQNRRILVAASTHRGEEDEIIRAHVELRSKYPGLLTIIVPRHVDRADEILSLTKKYNVSGAIHSRVEDKSLDKVEVYIVDIVGELGTFYSLSDIAFVGGSMIERGGHNILEPAKLGCAVLSGPHTFNFTEITNTFKDAGAITIVKNAEDIVASVQQMFDNPNILKELRYKSLQISQKQDGFISQTVSYLSSLIPSLNN
jgi:3-deoxy-D-manno-octulosonic-acid transferase